MGVRRRSRSVFGSLPGRCERKRYDGWIEAARLHSRTVTVPPRTYTKVVCTW